jgi:hypothetical protein
VINTVNSGYKVKPALQLLANNPNSGMWWMMPEDDPKTFASSIYQTAKTIEERNQVIFDSNLRFLRLYSGSPQLSSTLNQYSTSAAGSWGMSGARPALGLNVTQACVDTVVNSLCETKIRPMVVTKGGSFKLQKRAQLMNKFSDGIFMQKNVHEITTAAIKNGAIFGTGVVKVVAENGDISIDSILPTEIITCPGDSIYGKPRTLYQTRFVAKYTLMEAYPEFADALASIKSQTVAIGSGHIVTDCIKVVEAWHLSQKSADKPAGCHALVADGLTLFREPYLKDHFPFAFYRHTTLPIGFYGRGVPEELLPIQAEINTLMTRCQQALKLIAIPRIFLEEGSQVNENQLNSQIGAIHKYRGTPPIFSAPPTMPTEVYQQIERLYQKAFETQGIPLLQAAGKKPSGVDSGRALREYADQANTRFITLSQQRERFHIDVANLYFEACHDLSTEFGTDYKVISYDKKDGIEPLKYSQVAIKPDNYIVQVWPTNFFSQSPTAKLQEVQELSQAGFIPPEAALDILDFPDLQKYTELVLSGRRLVENNIEKMIETGEYIPPEETDDLKTAMSLSLQYLSKFKLQEDSDEAEQLIRQYMDDVESLIIQAQTPQGPVSPAGQSPLQGPLAQGQTDLPMGPPLASPAASPISDLLPNAPVA